VEDSLHEATRATADAKAARKAFAEEWRDADDLAEDGLEAYVPEDGDAEAVAAVATLLVARELGVDETTAGPFERERVEVLLRDPVVDGATEAVVAGPVRLERVLVDATVAAAVDARDTTRRIHIPSGWLVVEDTRHVRLRAVR